MQSFHFRSWCENLRACTDENVESNGGNEGHYGGYFDCPYNYFINGAQLRSEAHGPGDDTACKL